MLPLSYAIRNLLRSKSRLAQTVGGSALVVLLVMAAVAINQGMSRVLSASGSPNNVILLGTGSEESVQRSEVSENTTGIASASIPGIQEILGVRAVSGEIHFMNYISSDDGSRAQALIRGVSPAILHVHPEVRLTQGRFPAAGEVMVGRLAWRNLGLKQDRLKIGTSITLNDQTLRVVGRFAAPGTVMESEIWATIGDIRVVAQRETISCVVIRLEDPEDFSEVDLFAKQRLDLELSALRESDYYGRLSEFFSPLRAMIWITVSLIALGAVFGGINTLYAAFASRVREMGTLQAIGFGRTTLLLSLLQESTLACLTGTLLASTLAMLLLDGLTVPFSIGTFSIEINSTVALIGILSGLLLGIIGVIPPAIRCLKPALPTALRS
ncbi:MAG: ABC transporter permease [Luteolibacter sp.]